MGKAYTRALISGFALSMLFAAMKLDGDAWFVDWEWFWVICPTWIISVIWLFEMICRFLVLAMRNVWRR